MSVRTKHLQNAASTIFFLWPVGEIIEWSIGGEKYLRAAIDVSFDGFRIWKQAVDGPNSSKRAHIGEEVWQCVIYSIAVAFDYKSKMHEPGSCRDVQAVSTSTHDK